MKRGHSVDEFCAKEGITAKRRKTGREKKNGKRHRSRVSKSQFPDSLIGPSVSTCATLPQCNTGTVATSHEINNAELYIRHKTVVAVDPNVAQSELDDAQSHYGCPVGDTCSSISQEDILGVLRGLCSSYSLEEVAPQDQPLQLFVDESSSFLVGQHDQVFLTVVPGIVEASTQETQTLVSTEPITDLAIQPSSDSKSYSQQFSTKSFSDKIKERLENWYFATMEVEEKVSAEMKYPSHLLEWSERVKFTHARKWQQLEYHAPDYSKFD